MSVSMALVCDKCEQNTPVKGRMKVATLRYTYTQEGWTRLNGGVDLCPCCNGSDADYWHTDNQ